MNCPVKDETYLCETPCMIDKCPYQQGRADEQIQSIEDAKKQAAEYLDALDKAKKEAYQQGAREFAVWLAHWIGYSKEWAELELESYEKEQKGAEK